MHFVPVFGFWMLDIEMDVLHSACPQILIVSAAYSSQLAHEIDASCRDGAASFLCKFYFDFYAS